MKNKHIASKDFTDKGERISLNAGEEFQGLKAYQYGDSLKHAQWQSLAKGHKLQIKNFHNYVSKDNWLDYKEFFSGDKESALSKICFWAIELDRQGAPFGLKLPNQKIEMNSGAQHLRIVLEALASFEV